MVARFSPCCTRVELRAVLAGRLAEPADSQVESHLEQCPSCREQLERLAAGHKWWESAQSYLSDDSHIDDLAERDDGWERAGVPSSNDVDAALEDRARKHAQIMSLLPQGLIAPSDDPGTIGCIGQYRVLEAIGRGGMGVVLKAFDPALSRYVAIKVLAAELAHNASARRRFAREAQAAAAVVHDHVVPIYSVDAAGAMPYLVMAYIPGRSLQERIDETGPLDVREILRIGMQTAAGLAAAHAQGLVHRDIKPANILLENGVERVRITDFGLARAMDEASQTQSGILAGTPQYMAPEQALGEAIDYRTDLFSLGSVLYAMCTGHSPFRAASTVAVLRRICDTKQRPVREVNADIPESVANVVDRLLSKRPGDRLGSAEEVARILAELLAHLQHPPRAGRLFRRRVVAAFIAAAALAVGTAAALMGPSVNEADRHSDSQSSHQPESQPADAIGGSAARANAGHIESPLANPSPARRDVDSFEGELRTLHDELSRLEQLHWQDNPGLRSDELRVLNNSLYALEREIGGP